MPHPPLIMPVSFHQKRCLGLIALVLVASTAASSLAPNADASELRHTPIVRAVQRVRPAIVNIHGQKVLSADEARQSHSPRHVNGMGTGVVLDPRGYILTNYHVVNGVRSVKVTLSNKQTYTARLISYDVKTDLAVIKISAPTPLKVIPIGASHDLMPGEPVVAVGNAYGYEHTVTRGIISALHRTVQVSDDQKYVDLIQTDASINPGNSGGPLLNIDGEMIGINVAVRAGAQGIGFAIPVDEAMAIATKLLSTTRIRDTWHGITGKTARDGSKASMVVDVVQPKSPALKGGFQPGDVVQSVGEYKISQPLDFERALLDHQAGDEVEVTVLRRQRPLKLSLVLQRTQRASTSTVSSAAKAWSVLGMRLKSVSQREFRQINTQYRGGLSIVAIRADSPAARQGIRAGDILVGMHVWETTSLENVDFVLSRKDYREFSPMKFYILRGNNTLYGHLKINFDEPR
jgi:serine protease Do